VADLGLALQGKGEFQKALDYFRQALAFQEKAGNKRGAAAALTNSANCCTELKEFPTALKYLQRSLGLYKEIDYRWGEANSTLGVGRVVHYNGAIKGGVSVRVGAPWNALLNQILEKEDYCLA